MDVKPLSKYKPCLRRSNFLEAIKQHIGKNGDNFPTSKQSYEIVPPREEVESNLEKKINQARLEVKLLQRKLWEEEYNKVRPKPKFLKRRQTRKKCKKNNKTVSMAVLHKQHPLRKLQQLQIELIGAKIVVAIDELPQNRSPPQFRRKYVCDGVLYLECANKSTCKFLKSIVADLDGLWNWSPEVEIVSARDVDLWHVVGVTHLESTSESTFKRRLQVQNPELKTQHWRLLDTKATQKGWKTVFRVDDNSFDKLKASNFTAFWACGVIQFKPL